MESPHESDQVRITMSANFDLKVEGDIAMKIRIVDDFLLEEIISNKRTFVDKLDILILLIKVKYMGKMQIKICKMSQVSRILSFE